MQSNLAPIALFVYNRPWHTSQTLEALSRNLLADQSRLFIYADGPKANATEEQRQQIREVRDLIRKKKWCAEVKIVEQNENKGLADSIIDGVTKIVNEYGRIIVLEDDLVTSVGFLKYMNETLSLYENDERVMGVAGYIFPGMKDLPENYFIYGGANTWGWATWKRAWSIFNSSAEELIQEIVRRNEIERFNMYGAHDYFNLLKEANRGMVSSWGVRWYASVFLKGGLGHWPGRSLVNNIGHDSSGTHSGMDDNYSHKELAMRIAVGRIPVEESLRGRDAIIGFYKVIKWETFFKRTISKMVRSFKKFALKTLNGLGYNIERIPKMDASLLKRRLSKNLSLGYVHEVEAFQSIQVVSNNTMLPYERLISLYEQVIYCEKNDIEGDFVECGTWKGGSVGLMAIANLKHGKKRRDLHLFDSFTDICEPDEKLDGKQDVLEVKQLLNYEGRFTGELKPLTGIYDIWGGHGTLIECKMLLESTINYPEAYLHYHVGWFQNTLPVVSDRITSIAILRLDGDWYKSTEICLEYLYSKVVLKGLIIIDDFGYEGCKNATLDFMKKNNISPLIHHIDGSCIFWIKT